MTEVNDRPERSAHRAPRLGGGRGVGRGGGAVTDTWLLVGAGVLVVLAGFFSSADAAD